ncbi:MAG: hypothetical protein AB8G17_21480 [Gammaproteobacteria bacterium]
MKIFGHSYFTRSENDNKITYEVHQNPTSKTQLIICLFGVLWALSLFQHTFVGGAIALLIFSGLGAVFVKIGLDRRTPKIVEISESQINFKGDSYNISDISGFNWRNGNSKDDVSYVSTSGFHAGLQNTKAKAAARNMSVFMKLTADSRPIEVVSGLTAETADDLMMAVLGDIGSGE